MRKIRSGLVALAALAALAPGATNAAETSDVSRTYGVWRNPRNTVHLEIKNCGGETCGVVIWASAKAQADARESGSGSLIGQRILRNFEAQKNGSLSGRVYVPTLKMTFQGSAELLDGKTLKAKGCVIGNLLCKSQVWTRLDAPYAVADRTP
jgi:uncharacterized protein (DUF2147 family)